MSTWLGSLGNFGFKKNLMNPTSRFHFTCIIIKITKKDILAHVDTDLTETGTPKIAGGKTEGHSCLKEWFGT